MLVRRGTCFKLLSLLFGSLRFSDASSDLARSPHLGTWHLPLPLLIGRWWWRGGACLIHTLWKSMITFYVSATFSTRWFSLHQPSRCSTFFQCNDSSFPRISPTTVVSYSNLMIRLPSYLDTQLYVSSINNSGLRTQPWEDPVLSVIGLELFFPTWRDWGLSVRKTRIQRHTVVFRPSKESFSISLCEIMS